MDQTHHCPEISSSKRSLALRHATNQRSNVFDRGPHGVCEGKMRDRMAVAVMANEAGQNSRVLTVARDVEARIQLSRRSQQKQSFIGEIERQSFPPCSDCHRFLIRFNNPSPVSRPSNQSVSSPTTFSLLHRRSPMLSSLPFSPVLLCPSALLQAVLTSLHLIRLLHL